MTDPCIFIFNTCVKGSLAIRRLSVHLNFPHYSSVVANAQLRLYHTIHLGSKGALVAFFCCLLVQKENSALSYVVVFPKS